MKKSEYKFIIYFIILLAIIWGLMFVLKKITKNVESDKKMTQLIKINSINFIDENVCLFTKS